MDWNRGLENILIHFDKSNQIKSNQIQKNILFILSFSTFFNFIFYILFTTSS
jgi:hypothetical protein